MYNIFMLSRSPFSWWRLGRTLLDVNFIRQNPVKNFEIMQVVNTQRHHQRIQKFLLITQKVLYY